MHSLARRSVTVTVIAAVLASCAGIGSSGTETAATATSVAMTTSATTTTGSTTSRPDSTPSTAALSGSTTTAATPPATAAELPESDVPPAVPDTQTCVPAWAPRTAADQVTFARGNDIFTYTPSTGELLCLATVDRRPQRLDWNPAGDRLLVDSDLVLTAFGTHPSGYSADTAGISWSQPTGAALIAPSADGTALLHVNADRPDDVIDVAALAVTWTAAYHPSGTAIFSAGVSDDGVAGIYIADNRGRDPRPLVTLDDQTTVITELVVAHDGDWIAFVHDHTGSGDEHDESSDIGDEPASSEPHEFGGHVHRLFLPFLALDDLAASEQIPTGLVTSEQPDGLVAWTIPSGPVNIVTTVMTEDAVVLNYRIPEGLRTPVGFLDAGTSVLLVRPVGSSLQPGDLVLRPFAGGLTLVATGVSAATTRTTHDPTWQEPPLDIEQQAVG